MSFKDFLNRFVNSCGIWNVKHGSYVLDESEVTAETINWLLQFLTEGRCPPSLITPIIRRVVSDVLNPEILPSSDDLKTSNMKQIVLELLQKHSLRIRNLINNSELCTITVFNENEFNCPVYSVASMKNMRRTMEDRYICIDDFNGVYNVEDSLQRAHFYAIFDGHAGYNAACYSASHLPFNIANSSSYPSDPVKAIREAFIKTDHDFLKKKIKSGTTAVCALLYPQDLKLYISWVGDSKALLVKKEKIQQLVISHTPSNKKEAERITNNGGSVIDCGGVLRVNGLLNLSRALGDITCKPFVICDPDIECVDLDKEEDFLILASDGLWDHLNEKEAAMGVYEFIQTKEENLAANHLVKLAKERGSTDNITVIIVFLNKLSLIRKTLQTAAEMDRCDNRYNSDFSLNNTNQTAVPNANTEIDFKMDTGKGILETNSSINDGLNNIVSPIILPTSSPLPPSSSSNDTNNPITATSKNFDVICDLDDKNNVGLLSPSDDYDDHNQMEKFNNDKQSFENDMGPETSVDTDDIVMATESSETDLLEQSVFSHSKETLPSSDNVNPFENKHSFQDFQSIDGIQNNNANESNNLSQNDDVEMFLGKIDPLTTTTGTTTTEIITFENRENDSNLIEVEIQKEIESFVNINEKQSNPFDDEDNFIQKGDLINYSENNISEEIKENNDIGNDHEHITEENHNNHDHDDDDDNEMKRNLEIDHKKILENIHENEDIQNQKIIIKENDDKDNIYDVIDKDSCKHENLENIILNEEIHQEDIIGQQNKETIKVKENEKNFLEHQNDNDEIEEGLNDASGGNEVLQKEFHDRTHNMNVINEYNQDIDEGIHKEIYSNTEKETISTKINENTNELNFNNDDNANENFITKPLPPIVSPQQLHIDENFDNSHIITHKEKLQQNQDEEFNEIISTGTMQNAPASASQKVLSEKCEKFEQEFSFGDTRNNNNSMAEEVKSILSTVEENSEVSVLQPVPFSTSVENVPTPETSVDEIENACEMTITADKEQTEKEEKVDDGLLTFDSEDLAIKLNPDAKEFIPSIPPSPQNMNIEAANGTSLLLNPVNRHVSEDFILSQSPRKDVVSMEDMSVPNEEDFQEEIVDRPCENVTIKDSIPIETTPKAVCSGIQQLMGGIESLEISGGDVDQLSMDKPLVATSTSVNDSSSPKANIIEFKTLKNQKEGVDKNKVSEANKKNQSKTSASKTSTATFTTTLSVKEAVSKSTNRTTTVSPKPTKVKTDSDVKRPSPLKTKPIEMAKRTTVSRSDAFPKPPVKSTAAGVVGPAKSLVRGSGSAATTKNMTLTRTATQRVALSSTSKSAPLVKTAATAPRQASGSNVRKTEVPKVISSTTTKRVPLTAREPISKTTLPGSKVTKRVPLTVREKSASTATASTKRPTSTVNSTRVLPNQKKPIAGVSSTSTATSVSGGAHATAPTKKSIRRETQAISGSAVSKVSEKPSKTDTTTPSKQDGSETVTHKN